MNQRRAIVAICVMFGGVVGSSCSSTSPSTSSFFNWSVDGRSYQAATDGLTFSNGSQNAFAGYTCNTGQSATITTPSTSIQFQTGTYSTPIPPSSASTSESGAFELTINEGLAAQSGGPVPSWIASAGTLTITAVDGSHIAGSFNVTLVPATNSSETGTAQGTGTFDVPPFLANGSLCGETARR